MRPTMQNFVIATALVLILNSLRAQPAGDSREEKVYSGPQPGERLPSFVVRGVYDDLEGNEVDFVHEAGDHPLLLVFVHELTRPSVGLTRTVTNWAATQRDVGGHCAIVWLSEDRTEAEQYLRRARRSLNFAVPVGIFPDGVEGPGAYGLNRKVALTVLVAKAGRVTDNFALVQPSDTDAPGILEAFARHTGGKPPTLVELRERRQPINRRVESAVHALLGEETTEAEVAQRVRRIEKGLASRPAIARQLGRLSLRYTKRADFAKLGTEAARKAIESWAERFGRAEDEGMTQREAANHPRWRELLAPVIRKNASVADVERAIAAVEEFVRSDAALRAALGEKARAVVSSKAFADGGYGTERARAQLSRWAQRYGRTRRF